PGPCRSKEATSETWHKLCLYWQAHKAYRYKYNNGTLSMETTNSKSECIAVIGLGYVGLPIAVAFARAYENVVGFDISKRRIEALRHHQDWTEEVSTEELKNSTLKITSDPEGLKGNSFFVITVPTPVDHLHRPDLGSIKSACRIIGPYISKGSVV